MPMIMLLTTGSSTEGLGHIFRTLSLIAYIQATKTDSYCCVTPTEPQVTTILSTYEINHKEYHNEESLLDITKQLSPSHLVIDSRRIFTKTIIQAKAMGIRIIEIDCLHDDRLIADLNIYPNPHFQYEKLSWTGYQGQRVGGAAYTLVHPRFLTARQTIPPITERKKILISMGGSDPNCLTKRVLQWLDQLTPAPHVDVVIGPACPHASDIFAAAKNSAYPITCHTDCHDLVPLMSQACLLITTLGTTMYESAVLKLPCIVINNFESDHTDSQQLALLPGFSPLGFYQHITASMLVETINRHIDQPQTLRNMSDAIGAVIDGQGGHRIVDFIIQ